MRATSAWRYGSPRAQELECVHEDGPRPRDRRDHGEIGAGEEHLPGPAPERDGQRLSLARQPRDWVRKSMCQDFRRISPSVIPGGRHLPGARPPRGSRRPRRRPAPPRSPGRPPSRAAAPSGGGPQQAAHVIGAEGGTRIRHGANTSTLRYGRPGARPSPPRRPIPSARAPRSGLHRAVLAQYGRADPPPTPLAERMAKTLADPDALPPDLFDSAAVARLLEAHLAGEANHAWLLLLLLTFGTWHRHHLAGRPRRRVAAPSRTGPPLLEVMR